VYTPPPDPLLGVTLAGRYQIVRKLGEGGMGAVYVAIHTLLEKEVALKVLHNEFARKQDLVERFMQEAKAASRIRHENVIDISDFGVTPEGQVFFAMELLTGHDLHEDLARARLAGVPMPWARSRPIFLQVCSALSAAHAQGIVHRDLKPENIFLVEFLGNKDFVKLLDFGIAKQTAVDDGDRKLTRTGMLFGTPEYMSPEQARGEPIDHRVDIYAMGCILYQLVVGRVPFEAENFMGILSQHLTESPPPITPAQLARIGAPPEVAAIIGRALAKHRDERWPTIDDMANAIRALHGEAEEPVREVRVPRAASTPVLGQGRVKTAWTGSPQVPVETEITPDRKPSLAPWIAAGVILIAGGVLAGVVLSRDDAGGTPAPAPVPPAAGSAAAAPGSAIHTVATPDPPPVPPVPDKVDLQLETEPSRATVYELAGGSEIRLGSTPLSIQLDGGRAPRRFAIRRKGHQDKVVELTPDRTPIVWKTTLVKGASGAGAVEVVDRTGQGPASRPDDRDRDRDRDPKPPDVQVKPPDVQVKPPDVEVKPPDVQVKPPDPPPDPDLIDIKRPDELGSGAK
jgi:serine/threonine-protein kinase